MVKTIRNISNALAMVFLMLLPAMTAEAQEAADSVAIDTVSNSDSIQHERARLIAAWREKQLLDSIAREDSIARANYVKPEPKQFPPSFFGPVVYISYELLDSIDMMDMKGSGVEQGPLEWIDREVDMANRMKHLKQNYIINNPCQVKYNIESLPAPPKKFVAEVDPSTYRITVTDVEVKKESLAQTVAPEEVKRVNWLQSFNGSLQFSQAYISPNWYQGGNNNLNMIANAIYNVKLNQTFYPNLLFDTTVQYKLGLNNAPDDELRDYSISEDVFHAYSKFGLKAAKSWFYSLNVDFKTQLFNGYKKNSEDLKAAFLSPAELNIGLGMTYSYANADKKLNFDASIAPLSYNLKVCANSRMDETSFGIDAGKKTVSQVGSSAECKLSWKLSYNITYTSRFFLFSDYSYVQGDWENKLNFDVNQFLSTQIYVHLRYDSSTVKLPDTDWNHWQLKEILSFGFNYKFSTI